MIAPRLLMTPSRRKSRNAAVPRHTGCAFVWGGGTGASSVASRPDSERFQVCPKDFPAVPRQSGGAAPATFVGGLTMSERVVDEGQSWASDIIGVLSGVGLYSVLIFLVTFLCLYVPA